ncbi:MAG: hypothetical protein RR444_06665, partial [Oscillospiraceae bacterium]
MNTNYWSSHFAKRHQDQMIKYPNDFKIHSDFLQGSNEDEIRAVFARIHTIYFQIQDDISKSPDEFGMPLYSKDEYHNFSQQCRDCEQATFRPFVLLYHLFICSEINEKTLIVSTEKFKNLKP